MDTSIASGKRYTVKKDLRNKNATQLSVQAGQILLAITKSPYFSASAPRIVELAACYEKLKATLIEDNGAALPLAERNTAARNTSYALCHLASYVQSVSEGNQQIILSSGFGVRRSKSKIGLLPAPVIKRTIKIGITGCIKLMWQANTLAKLYKVYIREVGTPQSETRTVSTTRSSAILKGLESGKRYELQVSVMTTAGEGPLSNPITVCEAWL